MHGTLVTVPLRLVPIHLMLLHRPAHIPPPLPSPIVKALLVQQRHRSRAATTATPAGGHPSATPSLASPIAQCRERPRFLATHRPCRSPGAVATHPRGRNLAPRRGRGLRPAPASPPYRPLHPAPALARRCRIRVTWILPGTTALPLKRAAPASPTKKGAWKKPCIM